MFNPDIRPALTPVSNEGRIYGHGAQLQAQRLHMKACDLDPFYANAPTEGPQSRQVAFRAAYKRMKHLGGKRATTATVRQVMRDMKAADAQCAVEAAAIEVPAKPKRVRKPAAKKVA